MPQCSRARHTQHSCLPRAHCHARLSAQARAQSKESSTQSTTDAGEPGEQKVELKAQVKRLEQRLAYLEEQKASEASSAAGSGSETGAAPSRWGWNDTLMVLGSMCVFLALFSIPALLEQLDPYVQAKTELVLIDLDKSQEDYMEEHRPEPRSAYTWVKEANIMCYGDQGQGTPNPAWVPDRDQHAQRCYQVGHELELIERGVLLMKDEDARLGTDLPNLTIDEMRSLLDKAGRGTPPPTPFMAQPFDANMA